MWVIFCRYQETRKRLDAKYLRKILILKSVASSSLREYTGSAIFDSGISLIKRQLAFVAILSLQKSGTIFRMRPVSNQLVEPLLRSWYAPPKTVRFIYRKYPVRRFYRNAHARHYVRATSQHCVTLGLGTRTHCQQYDRRSTRSTNSE